MRLTAQITTESLARFVGGEAEIQNQFEDYLFRAEIADIKVDHGSLVIKFAWCAKNRGGPFGGEKGPSPDWDNETNTDYSASLEIYNPSDLGDGRMTFQSPITHETVVLFPADDSKMNPERIHDFPEHLKDKQTQKWREWEASR